MDITKENINPNPRDKANLFSILFFTYTIGMFKRGYQKKLDVDDLYNPIRSDRSKELGDRLERKWNMEVKSARKCQRTPSLFKVLALTFWPEYLYIGVNLFCIDILVQLSQPLMLGYLLDYFRPDTTTTKPAALWYAGGLALLSGLSALLINQYIMNAFHCGQKLRTACCALIYRKALRLSKTALGETPTGKIVNLLSNDVSRFDIVSNFIHYMWVAPLLTIIVIYFLYSVAGYAGVVGIVPVFLLVPLQGYTGKLSAIYRKQTALKTDERVRLMDEIICGVQVIKMYAWERPFEKLIKFARKAELKIVTRSSFLRGLFMTFNLFTTRVALFSTLLTMALTNQQITAGKVFVFMSYSDILAQTVSTMFVRGISEVAELIVAINRLSHFMVSEEFNSVATSQNNNNNNSQSIINNHIISMKDLTVKWNSSLSNDALHNLNINVTRGQLLGVIGPVGSGKSSILQTILGELIVTEGTIEVNASLSYASQEPWVFAATIRQNILFGVEYDKKRYSEVVQACALEKDFTQFPNGDLTIVGDRGASLSGGQKARINLARAVYRNCDIYLLDDPLSAVDTHVSKHLYNECINGFLANKTRILVTHQVHHLKDADHLIILNNGSIENEGTFKQLSESDNIYAKLLTTEPEATDEERQKLIEIMKVSRRLSVKSRTSSITSAISNMSLIDSLMQEDVSDEDEKEDKVKIKDMQEPSSKGKVKGSLFWKYFFSGGNLCFVAAVIILFASSQVLASGVDYFVSYWVDIEEFRNISYPENVIDGVLATPKNYWSTETCLYIYGGGLALLFICALTRSMLFYKLAMRSSQNMHNTIFSSIISATMRFFDTNPSGRILNRFSKDIGSVDELLPKVILDAGQILLQVVGAIILITVVSPYCLILVGFLGIFFLILRHIFLKTSKNIKRLEGILRSPVFTHLNATLQGLTTIRAFGAQGILRDEFDKHQDGHTSAWFMYIAAAAAFGFYLDLLCFIFISLVTFGFLTFGEYFGLSAGAVGLAITQASSLTGLVQWGIRQSAEVANQLMSVERVLAYKVLPKEKQPLIPKNMPKAWPNKGEIIFTNMGLKYADSDPLVLRNLNAVIKPNEKVGVVGRTGAGKSSLISALFRLALVEGEIKIDDIDTKDLLLGDLRSKISIIPQDPVLFSGTLRYNLDPFEEYNDEVLYRAIDAVELKDPSNIINKLENRVMDKGSNYSVGQRQLICLARAIIRNNKILMLDEATANVDPQTDALIQKTIRRKFSNCTVLTVAHRLNTIMDSDKVLVMDSGTIVEFDHPYTLLQNPDGIFYKMVMETGRATSEQLKKVARDHYQRQLAVPE